MCCTHGGHFAHFLLKLGKQQLLWTRNQQQQKQERQQLRHAHQLENGTRLEPREEEEQLSSYRLVRHSLEYNISHWYDSYDPRVRWDYETWDRDVYLRPLPNPVFLFELGQLGDVNETRRHHFRTDLARFLEISPDGYHPVQFDVSPGKKWDVHTQARRDARKINICDPQHALARIELMKMAQASSTWIRTVFLQSPTVYASNVGGHLDELLEQWMHDPCERGIIQKQ
jgi:hypothetical protein